MTPALLDELRTLRDKLHKIHDVTPHWTHKGQGEQEICRLVITNLDQIITTYEPKENPDDAR